MCLNRYKRRQQTNSESLKRFCFGFGCHLSRYGLLLDVSTVDAYLYILIVNKVQRFSFSSFFLMTSIAFNWHFLQFFAISFILSVHTLIFIEIDEIAY